MKKTANYNPDCIFCKIVAGEIPCKKVYEDNDVLAFLDISGDYKDHTLVIPKRHCTNILDASSCKLTACAKALNKISNTYIQKGYHGVNVFNNSGECSGQSVMHLHFHIIPRKNGDGYNINTDKK